MLDGDNKNLKQENRYVDATTAANLAKTPLEYINHLCSDGYLPHSFDKEGGFLPDLDKLITILNLNNESLVDVTLVSGEMVYDNKNGLPNKWLIKTSNDFASHHEDLPLFPTLIPKPLIEREEPVLLTENNEEEYIESPAQEVLLSTPNIQDLIESPLIEDLIETNVVEDVDSLIENQPISLVQNVDNVILKTEDNIKSAEVIKQEDSTQQKETVKQEETFDEEETIDLNVSTPKVIFTLPNNFVKSQASQKNKPVVSSKVFPVPHAPINTPLKSEHHLSLPPQVIPFSTPAPSAHTSVAAIYTQPGARASVWLPWMRTSQWSKKRVSRITRNSEMVEEENILPAIIQSKPNVIYTPVYVPVGNENKIKINAVIESSVKEVHKSFDSVIEQAPKIIRMAEDSIQKPVEIKSEVAKIDQIENVLPKQDEFKTPAPIINDALDSAFFGQYQKESPPAPKIVSNSIDTNAAVTQSFEVPINDSWDAEMFSPKK